MHQLSCDVSAYVAQFLPATDAQRFVDAHRGLPCQKQLEFETRFKRVLLPRNTHNPLACVRDISGECDHMSCLDAMRNTLQMHMGKEERGIAYAMLLREFEEGHVGAEETIALLRILSKPHTREERRQLLACACRVDSAEVVRLCLPEFADACDVTTEALRVASEYGSVGVLQVMVGECGLCFPSELLSSLIDNAPVALPCVLESIRADQENTGLSCAATLACVLQKQRSLPPAMQHQMLHFIATHDRTLVGVRAQYRLYLLSISAGTQHDVFAHALDLHTAYFDFVWSGTAITEEAATRFVLPVLDTAAQGASERDVELVLQDLVFRMDPVDIGVYLCWAYNRFGARMETVPLCVPGTFFAEERPRVLEQRLRLISPQNPLIISRMFSKFVRLVCDDPASDTRCRIAGRFCWSLPPGACPEIVANTCSALSRLVCHFPPRAWSLNLPSMAAKCATESVDVAVFERAMLGVRERDRAAVYEQVMSTHLPDYAVHACVLDTPLWTTEALLCLRELMWRNHGAFMRLAERMLGRPPRTMDVLGCHVNDLTLACHDWHKDVKSDVRGYIQRVMRALIDAGATGRCADKMHAMAVPQQI